MPFLFDLPTIIYYYLILSLSTFYLKSQSSHLLGRLVLVLSLKGFACLAFFESKLRSLALKACQTYHFLGRFLFDPSPWSIGFPPISLVDSFSTHLLGRLVLHPSPWSMPLGPISLVDLFSTHLLGRFLFDPSLSWILLPGLFESKPSNPVIFGRFLFDPSPWSILLRPISLVDWSSFLERKE